MAIDLNSGFEDIDAAEVKEDEKPEMYKPVEDVTDRLGFTLLSPTTKKVLILPVERFKYYDADEDKHHTFLVPDKEKNPDLYELCLLKCGDPEKRWVTTVMVYRTNKDGKPTRPLSGDLMALRLSAKQVKALKKISTIKKGLDKCDVLVDSDNPDYFYMDFQATESALWNTKKIAKDMAFDEELDEEEDVEQEYFTKEEIVEASQEMAANLDQVVAYEYSVQKLQKLLGSDEIEDEEDEEDLDDLDYDDEDDVEPAPKKKATPTRGKKKAKKKVEDEDLDDEDDFDELVDED